MDERAALKTIGNAIKHRRYLLVAVVALCTIGAGIASIVRPPTYQGTALLFVDERFNSSQGFDLALQAGQLLSAHFIQTATSQPVLDRACSGVYFNTPDTAGFSCSATALGPKVSANTVRGTDWIGVSVTSRSAAESAALANAVAGAMLDQNKADIDQLLSPTRTYLDGELKRLNALITAEETKIDALQQNTAPGQAAAIAGEQAQLVLLQSQYSDTYSQSQNLVIEQNRLAGSLTLVQPATAPLKPIDPDPLRYLAAGLAAGLCIGLAVVVLVERFDDRLFESEALAQAAGTRLVVAISQKESTSSSAQASQAYSLARANLLAQYPSMRKLLVVAASSRDRVRPIAAGLGMAAVKAGQRVLVVDAEANAYVMQKQPGNNGSLMTIVSAPSNGDGVVTDGALDGDGKYELTIMSAPSPDRDPAALIAARTADVAIVVATAGSTRFNDVRRTAETLRLAGIQVVASVFAHGVPETRPDPEPAPTDLYEVAVNQWRLPTWRGPGPS
jgi:capsular polysaccharide biosynthesis protein